MELEPADSLVCARADLFEMVGRFIASPATEQKHLLIFADSGMGKTSFLINYFDSSNRLLRKANGNIRLIALSQASADNQIEEIKPAERKNIDLFLDALDEDPRALERPKERIAELLRASDGYRTVTITCRTQFFRSDEQIPVDTGVSRLGPVKLNQKKHYQFIRAYLAPFDDDQIRDYLKRRFPGPLLLRKRLRAKRLVARVPSLSVRPMLLAHIPEILSSTSKLVHTFDVYTAMVNAWIERESSWIRPEHLLRFSEELAINLFRRRAKKGGEFATPAEIEALASSIGFEVSPDLVRSRSLLNRTPDGKYKFAHRSILEYFVIVQLVRKSEETSLDLTDQMALFLLELLDCASPPTLRLAHVARVGTRFVYAEPRLGHLTNFNLYKNVGGVPNIAMLLREPIQSSTPIPSPARSLGELLNDMASTGLRVELPQTREIRISITSPQNRSSSVSVYVTIWTNSYAVVGEVSMNASRVRSLIGSDRKVRTGLTLLCQPTKLTNDVSLENWSELSRVNVPDPFNQLPGDLSALANNPLVGFSYDADSNSLTAEIIKTSSADITELTPFGFLEALTLTQISKRPYGQVSPRRLEHRASLA